MAVNRSGRSEAQVVRNPFGLDFAGQDPELLQVARIKRVGAADGHGNAVHYHGVVFTDSVQVVFWFSTRHHKILCQHFEPVDGRLVLQDMLEMGYAKPQSEANKAVTVHVVCWIGRKDAGLMMSGVLPGPPPTC